MGAKVESDTSTKQTRLVKEFLVDHQQMSKLLRHTLVSLEQGDVDAAVKAAETLNRVAGPHIAFEESELYPRISGEQLVSETTRQLYAEHTEAALAVKKLLGNPQPSNAAKREIMEGLRVGVHHAEHCGSLVNLLAALPQPEQEESLQNLLELRDGGRLWTDRIR